MISWVLLGKSAVIARTSFIMIGVLHQAYTNWQRKSAAAISSYTQLLTQTVLVCYIGYMILLNQPLIIVVSGLIKLIPISIITLQKYFYANTTKQRTEVAQLLGIIALFTLGFIIFGMGYPTETGHFLGWLLVVINVIRFTPQVIHNWKRKSVSGYSSWYMSAIVFAGFGQMIEAIAFNMPLQSFLNAGYAIMIRMILAYQFIRYRK